MGIEKYIRRSLVKAEGYSPSTALVAPDGAIAVPAEEVVRLDCNENPYGCSPRVTSALADYARFNVYPDPQQKEVRQYIAEYTGMPAEHIVASNGGDELIDLIVHLFVTPGDEVIVPVPTFDVYRTATNLSGGKFVPVAKKGDFVVDVAAVKAAITGRTKVIFLTNPDNPTGVLMPQKDIMEVVATGLPVVVDEAYYEFCGETVAPLVRRYANLMVIRTFSKWAGLAGLRAGYGIFPPEIASYLLRIKPPFNLNTAAAAAIKESLKDAAYLMEAVQKISAERERLYAELGRLDFLKPFPSKANFVLCTVTRGNAMEITRQLRQRGILVRCFDNPFLKNSLRISVGRPEDTDRLLQALREIGGKANG